MTEPFPGKYPGFSRFQTVIDPAQAPEGWVLLDVFPAPLFPAVSFHQNIPCGTSYNDRTLNVSAETRGPTFLFGQSAGGHVAVLKAQLDEAQRAAADAQKMVVEAERRVDAVERAERVALDRVARLEGRATDWRVIEEHSRKLELDLAKIRTAVGEIELRRILAE